MTDQTPPTSTDLSRTPGQGLTKEQALMRLLEGHWRYLANEKADRPLSSQERTLHAQGQYPFAAILGCADSRVSPELIFDQGQGDLFVVRVAGNIVGNGTLASMEYAVEVLGVRLLVVLGHEQCGAVKAAIDNPDVAGPIGFLIKEIAPAVQDARPLPGSLLDNSVVANLRRSAQLLSTLSEPIARRIKSGDLRIVGAVYRMNTGDVDIKHVLG